MRDLTTRSALARRLRTIPLLLAGTLVVVVLSPLLALVALVVDLVLFATRAKPFMAVRLLAFGIVYLVAEVLGVLAAAAALALPSSRDALLRRLARLQQLWANTLLNGVEAIFGLRFRAEGADTVAPGPILVLSRHTSLVDNLLPARYVTRGAGIELRYVLKRELLVDPAIDVVGSILPNAFVDRSGLSTASIGLIGRLTTDLGPREGVLLFPEGTRFTPSKLARSMEILETRNPRLHELAKGLRTVLPPRTGGVGALLDSCRADVVVLAHRGLDGFARVADVWRGAMVGRTVDIRLWRIPYSEIPEERTARLEWLFGVWHDMDRWVMSEPSR